MENLVHNEDSEDGRSGKKLRSSDPDLKIVVGEGADQCDYWYYSQIIASQSHFIDTMLSSSMKESMSGEIKLPDLAPEDWDRMMKFLELTNCQKMTLRDAVELLPMYNKYEFRQALELCEKMVTETFNKKSVCPDDLSQEDIELLIQVFEAIDAGGLCSSTVESVLEFIRPFVKEPLVACDRLLSSDQVEHLVPLLQSAERSIHSIHRESFFSDWTEEDVDNPLFPRLFVKQWELWKASALLEEAVSAVWVQGLFRETGYFDGKYKKTTMRDYGRVFWASSQVPLPEEMGPGGDGVSFLAAVIMKRHNEFESAEARDCWTIILGAQNSGEEIEYPMWVAPKSQQMRLPPKDGWIPAKNDRVDLPHFSFPGTSPRIRYENDADESE